MRRLVSGPVSGPVSGLWILAVALFGSALGGCANNPMVVQGRMNELAEEREHLVEQNSLLQGRIDALSTDNTSGTSQVAQARMLNQTLTDELAAVKDLLRRTASDLAKTKAENADQGRQLQGQLASMRRRGGATITPNSSPLTILPLLDLPADHVRHDQDVIRITLPGTRLFEPGSVRLRAEGLELIGSAATELRRIYPRQIIGVEGHTDSDPVTGGQWRSNHELSMGRAMIVFEVFVGRNHYRPEQLFVVGHGPNHPMTSNSTLLGKQTNRRVDLVVYPEAW